MLKRFFLLTLVFFSISGFSQKKISVIYTGNMGVYISNGQSSVLIDGLHAKYGDDYLFPSDSLVDKIYKELQPDAILFTHSHGDHFNPLLSKNYLTSNKKAVLFGPSQVTEKITSLNDRLFTVATKDYNKQTIPFKDFKITGVKINHAGKRHISIENIGYIIDFGTKKILHVGDTNWMQEINLFTKLKLINEDIDIAILPYWMLLENNANNLIKEHINAKQIIATHISPRIKKQELLHIKKRYPDIHFLTTLEQQIQL
ncbi:L-ascorbate metabolism protein UlaG, beta-lactamase superfamily [Aquimarina amphilecti]|uniref:L-ascorbate metabolism protein UlaG, beta-lactamase superfamily n=1 Tax=Aquimarina amphilecti TaxID=1038014 RepID=A0A1H7Q4W3_AQUAM|nr:MBL fold metallo-hydrolase [Aquimarina amphilecti]SEL42347.1 L-ascorbate metabolism protein UlaG, beta-lactamase superfamily [Aquimarina amphilecti]